MSNSDDDLATPDDAEILSFMGEAFHTAFRKGCNDGMAVHSAIRALDPHDWKSALEWTLWCLRQMGVQITLQKDE